MPAIPFPGSTSDDIIAIPQSLGFGRLCALLGCSAEAGERGGEEMARSDKIAEDEYLDRAWLVAAACHDMRQPLQALTLFSEELKSTATTPIHRSLSRRIDQSVGILHEMVDQLLTMLQLDAPVCQTDCRDVMIGEIIDQVENDFEPIVREKGLQFVVERSSAVVRSDALLLYRAISNLVSNAISYTSSGRISVCCHVRHGKLRIEVGDTGIGIADEDIPRIFDDFYRVDCRQSRSHLGLGLANVRRIASLLGVRVTVRSATGIGSTFSIEMDMPAG